MNKKTKIIASSALAIAMCASVATGATFALFTSESQVDVSVSSGKVDVKAYADELRMYSPSSISDVNNVTVTEDTNGTFKNGGTASIVGNVVTVDKMTPGDKVTFELVVHNYSNVAIQYQTKLEVVTGYTLFSGLVMTFSDQGNSYSGMTAISNWATLPAQTESSEVGSTTVTIELPADRGNEYQDKTCQIAFTVNAVQGNTATTNPDVNTTYIYNESDLMVFAKSVNVGNNTYSGKTVKLMNDVDLEGLEWTPIGGATIDAYPSKTFSGTFDGNSKTISNLKTKSFGEHASAGLFGNANRATIKDVTVKNADIHSEHYAGGILAYETETTVISNCHVVNSTIVTVTEKSTGSWDNGDKVGGIVGYMNIADVSGCTVTNTMVQGYRDIGGVVGYTAGGTVANCTTSGNTVLCDPTNNYKRYTTFDEFDCEVFVGEGASTGCTDTGSVAKFAIDNVVLNSADFATALKQNVANIEVILVNDVSYDVTPWIGGTGTMGGTSTQSITINGNGHKITFNNIDNDWNGIYIKNEDATLTIKNATVDNSGYGVDDGPWNRHDLYFQCNAAFEDVAFTNAVAVAKKATFKNCSISDENAQADTYILWIVAGADVEIDGLDLNGNSAAGYNNRAIAIKDQYVEENTGLTKLTVKNATITSDKKAAILVTSDGGAEITLENVDISGVAADTVNAVWVDSARRDYADTVIVRGASKTIEP